MPTTTATSVEMAAPATPIGCPVHQPKIRIGASSMLRTTVAVCTTMPGLKLPVPRSADPIATMANCSDIAGVVGSAASACVGHAHRHHDREERHPADQREDL